MEKTKETTKKRHRKQKKKVLEFSFSDKKIMEREKLEELSSNEVKIKFKTEKDRKKGIYEMFDSGIKSGSIGDEQYIITSNHLTIFEKKNISYIIIK